MAPTSHKNSFLYRWLPFLIALTGSLITIAIWYRLVSELSHDTMIGALEHSLPWIILVLGVCLALLIGLAFKLILISRASERSFDHINHHFQKEITERMNAEEAKQKLEKALLQGQKLQAMGTLAGGIAHDFNNLLYAIIGYVELAREDVAKDSITHKNLGKVLDASKRGQELIARILAFSRRQHHDFTPLPIKPTIESVLALLKPTIPASVNLHYQSPDDEIMILGNQTQIHQVMVNIINNAVDAMDSEGTVTIQISLVDSQDPFLKQFPDIQPSHYCRIDISDTGHGMDQTTLARIFEPFFTTKEVGKGTGLGLSTVHNIIKEHQGEIVVESKLGRGTTFTILLPEYKENLDGEDFISRR